MGLSHVTPPATEPLTLAEAKLHLKQDLDDDNVLISALISASRAAVENYLSRSLMTQVWRQTFSSWCLKLERPPHVSVDVVRYVDEAGTAQTVAAADYQADLSGDHPACVVPAYGVTWPSFRVETLNPITVEFTAGYGDEGTDVPAPIRAALLLLIGHLYVNRDAVNVGNIVNEFPLSVRFLLDPYVNRYA